MPNKLTMAEARKIALLALEMAHPESMLRRTLTLQAARLRALAATMEEEGKCLKILGITEKRIPNAFSRGAERCGAADMARDWAANLEALLPNTAYQPPEGEARRLAGDAG